MPVSASTSSPSRTESYNSNRPSSLLFAGLAGDVIAARALARALLGRLSGSIAPAGLAQLVLTAACLQVQGRMEPEPSLDGVVLLLTGPALDAGGKGGFGSSPMQFLQYVAAELKDATPAARDAAVALAAHAAASGS
jgi:hypothetical protein